MHLCACTLFFFPHMNHELEEITEKMWQTIMLMFVCRVMLHWAASQLHRILKVKVRFRGTGRDRRKTKSKHDPEGNSPALRVSRQLFIHPEEKKKKKKHNRAYAGHTTQTHSTEGCGVSPQSPGSVPPSANSGAGSTFLTLNSLQMSVQLTTPLASSANVHTLLFLCVFNELTRLLHNVHLLLFTPSFWFS